MWTPYSKFIRKTYIFIVALHGFYSRKISFTNAKCSGVLPLQVRLVANLSDTHPRISRKHPAEQGMDVELLTDICESISRISSFASKESSQKCFLLLKVPLVANLCKKPVASSRTHVSKQDMSFQNLSEKFFFFGCTSPLLL